MKTLQQCTIDGIVSVFTSALKSVLSGLQKMDESG